MPAVALNHVTCLIPFTGGHAALGWNVVLDTALLGFNNNNNLQVCQPMLGSY